MNTTISQWNIANAKCHCQWWRGSTREFLHSSEKQIFWIWVFWILIIAIYTLSVQIAAGINNGDNNNGETTQNFRTYWKKRGLWLLLRRVCYVLQLFTWFCDIIIKTAISNSNIFPVFSQKSQWFSFGAAFLCKSKYL